MNTNSPRVAVIGGGIVGASIAYALAKAGAAVFVHDQGFVGRGVTSASFGWVNVSHGKAASYHHLRLEALEAWHRLSHDLGDWVKEDWRGALVWRDDEAWTEAFARDHADWGYETRIVGQSELRQLEPGLADPPKLAAYSPREGAVDPSGITRSLISRARDAGAIVIEQSKVQAITTKSGRVTSLQTDAGLIPADYVVLAAGLGSLNIDGAPKHELEIENSPALLVRFRTPETLVNRIVSNSNFEIRQPTSNLILAAEDCLPDTRQPDAEAIGQEISQSIQSGLRNADRIELVSVTLGHRPIPKDDLPILGASSELNGLYLAVMHAGVTLAPLAGERATSHILHGMEEGLVPPPPR
jgi:glycine/D-amino acid oxidase-like deaminating enzyme